MRRQRENGSEAPSRRSTGAIVVTVLGFAVVFPLAAHLSGMNVAIVTATLAALPGILIAALGTRR